MTNPQQDGPTGVPELLRILIGQDPGRPRLTWYGPDGERIELSAKVLDNWVAKTANLLVEELDAGPGTRVGVLLPAHWRTVVWLLAAWSVGAHVLVPDAGPDRSLGAGELVGTLGPDDVLVGADPAELVAGPSGPRTVAVALGGLATSFGPGLPAGAVDAAAEVRSYGDVFVQPVRPAPGDAALTVGAAPVLEHAGLLAAAARDAAAAGWPDGVRLLTGAGPDRAVRAWLAPLVRSGSLVLHHDPTGHDPTGLDPTGLDPAALDRLAGQEGVTATLL